MYYIASSEDESVAVRQSRVTPHWNTPQLHARHRPTTTPIEPGFHPTQRTQRTERNTPFTRWSWLHELALRAHDERSSSARRASSSSQLHRV